MPDINSICIGDRFYLIQSPCTKSVEVVKVNKSNGAVLCYIHRDQKNKTFFPYELETIEKRRERIKRLPKKEHQVLDQVGKYFTPQYEYCCADREISGPAQFTTNTEMFNRLEMATHEIEIKIQNSVDRLFNSRLNEDQASWVGLQFSRQYPEADQQLMDAMMHATVEIDFTAIINMFLEIMHDMVNVYNQFISDNTKDNFSYDPNNFYDSGKYSIEGKCLRLKLANSYVNFNVPRGLLFQFIQKLDEYSDDNDRFQKIIQQFLNTNLKPIILAKIKELIKIDKQAGLVGLSLN